MPLTLEEIMQRFTARRTVEPPTTAIEPIKPKPDQAPVVINGLGQLLVYLAEQDKRITALEQEVKQTRGRELPRQD